MHTQFQEIVRGELIRLKEIIVSNEGYGMSTPCGDYAGFLRARKIRKKGNRTGWFGGMTLRILSILL